MTRSASSQMVEILRRLGEASAAPIHMRKLLVSPAQDFFGFTVTAEHRDVSRDVFERLGRAAVNIRLISQYGTEAGDLRIRLSVDRCSGDAAREIFQHREIRGSVVDFEHLEDTRILSLYPFNGRSEVVERVFGALRRGQIDILATSSATSVISCLVPGAQVDAAVQQIKRVIVLQ